jgi:WS/DGAT/MGAT family acyltransferase
MVCAQGDVKAPTSASAGGSPPGDGAGDGRDTSLLARAGGPYRTVMKFLGRRALARAALAVPRTVRFMISTTMSGEVSAGLATPGLSVGLAAGVAMDEALLAMAMTPNRLPRRADFTRVGTELADARRLFSRRGWIAHPATYHRTPPPLTAAGVETSRGWALGLGYERITYDSAFATRPGEPGGERWMAYEPNRRATAAVLRHPGAPRPWVVAVHGFAMGYPFMDFAGLHAATLHRGLGLNVALPVLPLHGQRKVTRVSGEPFLSFDMMNTVHGLTQAVWDIRRLLSWIRSEGDCSVGVYGVSLGAYVASLLAGIDDGLDAVVAGIPVVDFPALFHAHSPVHIKARSIEHHILGGVAEDVCRVVSPLAFEPKVPHHRRYVFAGYGDRLAVPAQARALWEHWDKPRISWYPGNHVGYLWSRQVEAFVRESLSDAGLEASTDPPPRPPHPPPEADPVEPMVGLDAKFLYSETPSTHMHTLKVAVFGMGSLAGAVAYDQIVAMLGRRLDRLPPFRRRAVPVPLGLDHPVWIEDPDFDLRRHVTRRTVAAPGGDRELAAVVAEVASRPLRRDRPLWELVVVEGLAGGRLAVVAKVHHAVADGGATVALLQRALAGRDGSDRAQPWHPDPVPTRADLLRSAARHHVTRVGHLPALARRSVRGLRASEARRRSATTKPPLPFDTPRTPFNVALSPARTYAMTTLPLDELKVVRRSSGATLNDVFLAVCGGALRAYLRDAGALPDRPLVASVPVSTDSGDDRLGGNRVDNLYVSIGTDIADPLERLRHIHAVAAASKDVRSVLGNDLMEQRADVVPPQLYALAVRTWSRTGLANHVRPPVNVVLSNVPGPRERLRVGQAELEAIYSVGPILEGIGLNVTAWSYADALHVSVLGCPESLPDPWLVADALHGSLADLTRTAARAS